MNKSKVTLTAVLVISTLLLLGSCTALIKEIREEPIYKTAPEETKPEKKTPSAVETQPPPHESELAAAEQEVYRLVNEQRAEHNLHRQGNRVYATQKFMTYIARLTGPPDNATLSPKQAAIPFALNTRRLSKYDLTVLVRLPDENAKWPTADGRYYRGLGYVTPQWTGANEFTVELPVSTHGKGTYAIQLGAQGNRSVGQKQFTFNVK